MSPTRKRKYNYKDSLNSSERGQENKGCACKVAKVNPKVAQSENNSPRVRLPVFQLPTPFKRWFSSVAHNLFSSCTLTGSKDLTDSF